MTEAEQLKKIREKIDVIDQHLQQLINQRAQCALEVAKIKQRSKSAPIYYRPEREAQILRQLNSRHQGPLTTKDVAEIFLLIMAKCRALQNPIKIAAFGTKKSSANKAAIKHFGPAIIVKSFDSIPKIFHQVEINKTNYGVVPVENSVDGSINSTLDQLTEFSGKICGEIELETPNGKNNITRFLIIGNSLPAPSGNDKTSLLISIANKPGTLAKIFQPFANHEVNVIAIEPRAYRNNVWNYVFFVDIEGHQEDEIVQKALNELSKQPLVFKILGSYPKGYV